MTAGPRKTVIVAGGAGDVGAGIVEAFAVAGCTVVVPSRSRSRLNVLADMDGELDLVETDLTDTDAARSFAAAVTDRHGRIDAVVAALGGWSQSGRLLDIVRHDWDRVLHDNLTSHLLAAQVLAPLIARPGGVYVMINGGAAENPVPGAAAVSVGSAAQIMLMRALDQELRPSGGRAVTLQIDSVVATRARARPKPEWITAREVGDLAVLLASTEASAFAGRVLRAGEPRRAPG